MAFLQFFKESISFKCDDCRDQVRTRFFFHKWCKTHDCKFYSQAVLQVAIFVNLSLQRANKNEQYSNRSYVEQINQTRISTPTSEDWSYTGFTNYWSVKKIKDTLTYLKKLEADNAVVKTVNDRRVERVVKTERQC